MSARLLRLAAAITIPRSLYALAALLAAPAALGVLDAWSWVVMDAALSGLDWTVYGRRDAALVLAIAGLSAGSLGGFIDSMRASEARRDAALADLARGRRDGAS
jgi:hypothetical protein